MTSEEYARHFANVPHRVLLELVDDPDDNDPVAVQAARAELLKRHLPEEELASLRAERFVKEEIGRKRVEKADRVKAKAQAVLSEVGNTIMADPLDHRAEVRAWWFMMIVIGIMLFASAPRFLELRWIAEMRYSLYTVEQYLPLLILPTTLVLLWKKRRAGWFLGTAMTTWSLALTVISVYENWGRQPSGVFALDFLFPVPSEEQMIGGMLFAAGLMATFQLRRSLNIFHITERERWLTITLAVGVTAWMWSCMS